MNVQPLSTVVKCLDLLDVLAGQSAAVRLSELGRLAGSSRATTYQRLVTLIAAGWVERLPEGSYRLSTLACRIAASALEQAGFGERAQPILDEVARQLGEAVSLVVLEGDKIVIARRAEAQVVLRTDLRVGAQLSYKDSASGAVWLAFGPKDLMERVRRTGDKAPSRAVIEKARLNGVSIGGGGKTLPGIAAMAVPVTRNGVCLASLSVSSPDHRFDADRFLPVLRSAAERLAQLGGAARAM